MIKIKIGGKTIKLFNLEEAVQFLLQKFPDTFTYENGKLLITYSNGDTTEVELNFVSSISLENNILTITKSNNTSYNISLANQNIVGNGSITTSGKFEITSGLDTIINTGDTFEVNSPTINLKAGADVNVEVGNEQEGEFYVNGNQRIRGNLEIVGDGKLTVNGKEINKLYSHNITISFGNNSSSNVLGCISDGTEIEFRFIKPFELTINFISKIEQPFTDYSDLPQFQGISGNVRFTYNNVNYRGTIQLYPDDYDSENINFSYYNMYGIVSADLGRYFNIYCSIDDFAEIISFQDEVLPL